MVRGGTRPGTAATNVPAFGAFRDASGRVQRHAFAPALQRLRLARVENDAGLLTEAADDAPPGWAEYYSALARALIAGKNYRYYAPMKDEDLEAYHRAMEEFDAAWQAFEEAAERVGKRLPEIPRR